MFDNDIINLDYRIKLILLVFISSSITLHKSEFLIVSWMNPIAISSYNLSYLMIYLISILSGNIFNI